MDWDKLRVFHAVADAGSLTHAGETLHLSQSAVSRQIRSLEEDVGATLFHRHPRGLILTQEGEHLHEATQAMLREVNAAQARIRDARENIGGELRVTTTVGFGTLWLAPRLKRLLDQAPNMTIDLMLNEAVLDLPMREADIAIRMREPNQPDVIRRPIMDVAVRLYATEQYIADHGQPQSVEDLNDHRLISYSPNAPQPLRDMDWLYRHLRNRRQLITVNNYYGVMQAARNHLGVAAIPDYMVRDFQMRDPGAFVHVVPELESPHYPIFLVYAEELRGSRRIALFREFIIDEVQRFNAETA